MWANLPSSDGVVQRDLSATCLRLHVLVAIDSDEIGKRATQDFNVSLDDMNQD